MLDRIPIVDWPLLQLGLPALFFLGAAYLFAKSDDGVLVRTFECTAVALVGVMGYYVTRHVFHVDENILFNKAGFFERGVITNILFAYGVACLIGGRIFNRIAFSWSGALLSLIAVFRIIYFDLFLYNPLWADQEISGVTLFNSLLLPFGLPLIWASLAVREFGFLKQMGLVKLFSVFGLGALFVLISLNVRYFFQGADLRFGALGAAEIYSYSVAWAALGIGLALMGVVRSDKMLRFASLAVMLVTAGKVFLYDASELEGLYRVFSFFGLGLCLIGLSWFYTKFVFAAKNTGEEFEQT